MSKRLMTSNEILNGRYVVLVIEESGLGSTGQKKKKSFAIVDAELNVVAKLANKPDLETAVQKLTAEHQVEVQAELEEARKQQELEATEI